MQNLTLTLMDSGPLIQKVTSFLGRTVFPVSEILDSSWCHKFPKLSAYVRATELDQIGARKVIGLF